MPRQAPKPISEASLHQAALHYLERFAASGEMVRRVLSRRVEQAARAALIEREDGARVIERVIARLLAAGLIDDGVFAEARSRSLRRRGASERAIRARLCAQGVSGERVQTALAALRDDGPDAELAAALTLARRRRLGPFRAGDRTAYRLRDLSIMARAGFSVEVARRVIEATDADSLAAELENLSEC